MMGSEHVYLRKAVESLAGAESEYANSRYNNAANRCYYACFQAAVHALAQAGVSWTGAQATWSHEAVQASFARELISRRKRYSADLRDVLIRTYLLRLTADYREDAVSATQASRALRRARQFVQAVQEGGRV